MESEISTSDKEIMHMDVASKVAECVAKIYREDMNSAEVLEDMWLAMQM